MVQAKDRLFHRIQDIKLSKPGLLFSKEDRLLHLTAQKMATSTDRHLREKTTTPFLTPTRKHDPDNTDRSSARNTGLHQHRTVKKMLTTRAPPPKRKKITKVRSNVNEEGSTQRLRNRRALKKPERFEAGIANQPLVDLQ